MSLTRISLESFEIGDVMPPKNSPDYIRGLKDGADQAAMTRDAKTQQNLEQIATALNDMTFGFVEAQSYLMERIGPLLAQVSTAVLPQIMHETFALHLVEALTANFETNLGQPVKISVAPDVGETLQNALADQSIAFEFQVDANLDVDQAVLHRNDTHIMLDLPDLILTLQAALEGVEPSERTQIHG